MKRKSKLIVFILSVIPGLSHIYLGFFSRGYIFMGAAAAGTTAVIGLCTLIRSQRPMILLLGLPILWFIALIDSFTLTERINHINSGLGSTEDDKADLDHSVVENRMREQNRKITACLLSVIPGAGHMFLGYQRLGLEFMALFFFCFFFIDWLRIGFFMFIIPVIWFYTMFDALHKASGDRTPDAEDDLSALDLLGETRKRWNSSSMLGYGLIGLGLLLIFDRIISPMIPFEIRGYLQTGIIAILFIAGGVKILIGGWDRNDTGEEEVKDK